MQLSVKLQTPKSNLTPSLLDTLEVWLTTPEHAYSSWIRLQDLRSSSQRVYTAMFRRFCEWLTEHQLRLDQCSAETIRLFLAAINPNLPVTRRRAQTSRQRQQYVRLLERVYAHLGGLGLQGSNPGRQAGEQKVGAGADRPARFLSVEERDVVIALAEKRLDELRCSGAGAEEWVAFRDLALVAAALGGGLKPSQLSSLSLNCIKLEEGVIDNSGTAHSHRARLAPFAQDALAAWLAILTVLSTESLALNGRAGGTSEQWRASQLVFVADRSGRGFGRFATSQRMHVSSVFRRIQEFLVTAGVTGIRISPQTLRNTYAAWLIEEGATDMELLTSLGVTTEMTIKRIRASWAMAKKSTSP